ncbi:MAG TPA: c-type cytochrome [Azospirillum sp.]|nr:c-type cytochrome [Azospirillum sp.]
MRRTLTIVGSLLAAQAVGAFLFAWSGLYDIGAAAGHWPITRWLLEFGMRNSIKTQSMFVDVPDLEDPALIQRGAGHYENGCAPCHGAPAAPRSPISRHMLPVPPYLPARVANWEPEELYWITHNGIKYTGMPAWPAQQRDDEPWAVTAFLLHLGTMDAAEYRRLAFGEEAPAADKARLVELAGPTEEALRTCAQCHGYDGAGRGTAAFPRLSGQSAVYLLASLKAYGTGARPSGIMRPHAAALTDAEMRMLAEYYASRTDAPPLPRPDEADPLLLRQGEDLARSGDPKQGVASCMSCHGPGTIQDPRYPRLAGQYADYIADQLRLWLRGARGDTPLSRIMAAAVPALTDEQIRAVSLYYASAEPPPMAGE